MQLQALLLFQMVERPLHHHIAPGNDYINVAVLDSGFPEGGLQVAANDLVPFKQRGFHAIARYIKRPVSSNFVLVIRQREMRQFLNEGGVGHLGSITCLRRYGHMHNALLLIGVGHDSQYPETFITFLTHEHGALTGVDIDRIDLILFHGFTQQLYRYVAPALQNFAQALRQIIKRQGKLTAGPNLVFRLQFIVALDETLGNDITHKL